MAVDSVNGLTGNVFLTGSEIKLNNSGSNTTVSTEIGQIILNVAENKSNIEDLEARVAALEAVLKSIKDKED